MSQGKKLKIALAGNPNCGKTSLFNALTGGRAKVGNYPGVTVERKEGLATTPEGQACRIMDLPGTYSLNPKTPDEVVTRDILLGRVPEEIPDLIVAVADATHLERGLGLALELKSLNIPLVLAVNMMDLARQCGIDLDLDFLSRELAVPVVATVAPRGKGIQELLSCVDRTVRNSTVPIPSEERSLSVFNEIRNRFAEVDRILSKAVKRNFQPIPWTDRIDRVLLHPFLGSLFLGAVLVVLFQAIFIWAESPMEAIKIGVGNFGEALGVYLTPGPLKSLLLDGVLTGVGSILVFLPQILLLFLFILILEDSGYMARAAFLMDRMMGKAGLPGRAFIPLLSSYACAVPGIMATRTIGNRRDRLVTILIAPLMTCSARLPVYSMLIAAFIPNRTVFGEMNFQGLVMFGLYLAGIISALGVATVLNLIFGRSEKSFLVMELPSYKWPNLKSIVIGLFERAYLFIRKAGTVILSVSVILWFLASYPKAPPEMGLNAATGSQIHPIVYTYAGQIGKAIEPLVAPIGFNWKIAVALIPGFVAREVMIGSLATVYALEKKPEGTAFALGNRIAADWSLATALSLMVWYILACQCLSTLAVTRRETNSWKWPGIMLSYMTSLAYGASFLTYQLAIRFGLG